MKKKKKLNLGKIKIAGVSNLYTIIGGVTTNCNGGGDTQANTCVCQQTETCNTNACPTDMCDSTPIQCPTTIPTRTNSDACGGTESEKDFNGNGGIC